jgi:hypothetical protein
LKESNVLSKIIKKGTVMTRVQRIVFSMLLVQTAGILLLQHMLADNFRVMGTIAYTVITSLFIGSRFAPRLTATHAVVGRAIMFIWLGDFFLVFLGTLPWFSKTDLFLQMAGMVFFMCAYGTLIWLYTRRFRFAGRDVIALLPVLFILIPVLIILLPYIKGVMLAFALLFAAVVGFMAWNALCTIHRGYFSKKAAIRFAISGSLMFLSDMGVAFVFFYPGMQSNVPFLENEIWITYVPSWALVFVNLLEEKLLHLEGT